MPKFMPDWIQEVGAWVECLFEKHKFVRRSVIGLFMVLTPFMCVWTFRDPTIGAATALGSFMTAFAAVMKFYGDHR